MTLTIVFLDDFLGWPCIEVCKPSQTQAEFRRRLLISSTDKAWDPNVLASSNGSTHQPHPPTCPGCRREVLHGSKSYNRSYHPSTSQPCTSSRSPFNSRERRPEDQDLLHSEVGRQWRSEGFPLRLSRIRSPREQQSPKQVLPSVPSD